jgi:hypothetical protein
MANSGTKTQPCHADRIVLIQFRGLSANWSSSAKRRRPGAAPLGQILQKFPLAVEAGKDRR